MIYSASKDTCLLRTLDARCYHQRAQEIVSVPLHLQVGATPPIDSKMHAQYIVLPAVL
jgi:hypothetical protein